MRPPFGLVFVHGDGSRVLRLNVPRWLGYATLVFPAAVAAGVVSLAGAQALLRWQRGELAGLQRRVAEQRQLIDGFRTGVASVRSELTAWKSLHASMWETFGPEWGAGQQGPGTGGAVSVEPPAAGPADELNLLLASVAEEGPRLRELERVIGRTGEVVNALPLRWPVRGRVNSEFGRRPSPWSGAPDQHDGIDISTAPGTPVTSPANGRVLVAGAGGDYGRHVLLEHANGVRSLYGHLGEVDVKAGQPVAKGQVLGLTGSSGRSTGPHLHYELRVDGKATDPRKFLWDGAE